MGSTGVDVLRAVGPEISRSRAAKTMLSGFSGSWQGAQVLMPAAATAERRRGDGGMPVAVTLARPSKRYVHMTPAMPSDENASRCFNVKSWQGGGPGAHSVLHHRPRQQEGRCQRLCCKANQPKSVAQPASSAATARGGMR